MALQSVLGTNETIIEDVEYNDTDFLYVESINIGDSHKSIEDTITTLNDLPYYSASKFNYGVGIRANAILEYSYQGESNGNYIIETNVPLWYISASGNGYFEPKLAGAYLVVVNDIAGGTAANEIQITVNNTYHLTAHSNHISSWENVTCHSIVRCNGTTDKIYIRCNGTGGTYGGSYVHSRLKIEYIAP